MLYMTYATQSSGIISTYEQTLTPKTLAIYKQIVTERTNIYYMGYALGILLSILFIAYNTKIRKIPLTSMPLVCIVVAICFLTNYFYYVLSPKTTYMLDHLTTPEETKAWLIMYKGMQRNYHMGLFFGVAAAGFMAFAFRC
jgi:uncharacterized membrane protein